MSVVLGMEKATNYTILGTALSVSGAITVEMWKHSAASAASAAAAADPSSSVGFFLVVVQCLCMAGLIITLKPLSSVYPTTTVTAWYYAVASVLTIFACMAAGLPAEAYALTGRPMPWIALAYVTVVATFYCYNAYSWALARAPPGMVTMYSTLQPVGTAFLSVLFLEKPITMGQVAGGMLVVAGLMVSIYEKTYAHGKQVDSCSERPHHDSDEERELTEKKRLLSPRQNVTPYDRIPTHEP
jgi:drug/metabolite transporter (DMT)-like permease